MFFSVKDFFCKKHVLNDYVGIDPIADDKL